MLYAYTVCFFCFEKLERSSKCSCSIAKESEQKFAIRYADFDDTQIKASQPIILSLAESNDSGQNIGVQIILAPELELGGRRLSDFYEAVQWIEEIINCEEA